MKNQVFGRKVGSTDDMALLIDGGGVSTGGRAVDPAVTESFAVANARRAVKALRESNIEGFVVFEGDPTRYEFSPNTDFSYPAIVH